MTEKFLLKSVCGEDKIFKKEDSFPMTEKQIVNELNTNEKEISELIKENKKLQSINQDHCDYIGDVEADFVRLEQENKELKIFKDKVFALIDARIEIYKHKPFMAPVSAPMSVNFDEDTDRLGRLSELEQLKEELSE